ncbi:MAG: UPF0149 family protein [Candidatus Saccharibacteria bacterium]|nr:UPF0149 family protein [Rhodoferax sp.]
MNTSAESLPPSNAAVETTSPEAFDEIDAILDEMRTRFDETPQWEFCEGFLAALVCCRRPIPQVEYLDVLLGIAEHVEAPAEGSFADTAQRLRFLDIWDQRLREVKTALDTPTETLDLDTAYHPEVMDVRGAMASLSEAERVAMPEGTTEEPLPAFAQIWALGFMYVLESWPDEWVAPREIKAAKWYDLSIQCIVALTEDDDAEPTLSPFSEDGPPTLSVARLDAFADAIWSVYDLREIWRGIGPRVETVHRAETPGRNDPCHCGSGKKFKKCHGV